MFRARTAAVGRISVLLLAVTVVVTGISSSHGSTREVTAAVVVNTNRDGVDAAPGDGLCSTAEGDCSLRAAIQEANTSGAFDTIGLPGGPYILSLAGRDEDAAASGDLDITGRLTINGGGASIQGESLDRLVDVHVGAEVTLTHLTIYQGDAGAGDGGGVRNSGSLTLQYVDVEESIAQSGGGISSTGTLAVSDSVIARNDATAFAGGVDNAGAMTVERSTLQYNDGPSGGGGIRNSGNLTVTDSTFWFNGALGGGRGGGISNNAFATLINATVSENGSALDGGGIANVGGRLALTNVTVSDNNIASVATGGIFNGAGSTLTMTNTLLANGFGDCLMNQPLTSSSHSLDSDGSCGLSGPGDLSAVVPGAESLGKNGGPTRTVGLRPYSPAIDAGDNEACPSADQRGVKRPVDGDGDGHAVCDIGAFELASNVTPPPPPPLPTPIPYGPFGDVDCSHTVNSIDAALILQFAAGIVASLPCEEFGSVTIIDNRIDSIDAFFVLQFVAGFIGHLPCCV